MEAKLEDFERRLSAAIDGKTKPIGSLGQIETLAATISRIQHSLSPQIRTCVLTIFAGDHGMATAGVSAFPQVVTRQMVLNFLSGGAAANVFAKSVGARLRVVNAGVTGAPIEDDQLIDLRIAPGTENAIERPAMSFAQLDRAIEAGRELATQSTEDVACFGEMGIGNTSSASLIAAKLLGRPIDDLVGRGTGLDDKGLRKKAKLLDQAARRTAEQLDVRTALAEYGGFEIAMMAGGMLGAAARQHVVVVDGFIATVSALCAVELDPDSRHSMVFAHQSAEVGHGVVLQALKATPLLQLDMRLGEGTGALLAFPLIKAAALMLSDMASFESAGVSERS